MSLVRLGLIPLCDRDTGICPDALAAELSARLLWQTANMSSDSPPDLHMLNVVVRDMAASLAFCRRLGIAVPAPGDAAGAHVQLNPPGIFSCTWAPSPGAGTAMPSRR